MKGIGPVFGGSDKELCYPVLHLFMKQAMSYFDQGYTKANLSFQKDIERTRSERQIYAAEFALYQSTNHSNMLYIVSHIILPVPLTMISKGTASNPSLY